MSQCPKCGYERCASDIHIHPDICPACGIAYSKWRARLEDPQPLNRSPSISASDDGEPAIRLSHRLRASLLYVPARVAPEAVWARAFCLAGFALWSGYFITAGISWEKLGGSFMHLVNLPFHEFGHLLFMPLGRFMMILGGSLFQVLLPLLLLGVFALRQRDTFAASLMLWWCGQNFIDLAPYIADAPYRALPLVGGGGEESHDWGNLLTMMNALESAYGIARGSFVLGAGVMLVALLWGAWLVRAQWRNSQAD